MIAPEDPAHELVIRVIQHIGAPTEADNRIRDIVRSHPDWETVIQFAASQGVIYPLRDILSETNPPPPESILRELQSRSKTNAVGNLQAVQWLHNLVAEFKEREIRVIPYKGPVVAEYAYGDINRRWFKDLDFLVAEEDTERAISVLYEYGYEQAEFTDVPTPILLKNSIFRWEREFRFPSNGSRIEVELRPQFMTCDPPSSVIFSDLWRRRTSISLAGQPISVLSPEDRALLLLIHGTKHTWCRLSWVYDVALLFNRDILWGQVIKRAEKYGWKTGVLLGLAVVAEMSRITLPRIVTQEIAANRRAVWGSSIICSQQWSTQPDKEVDWEPWTEVVLMNDSWRGSVQELVDVLFSPRKMDHQWAQLPPKLYSLYYFVRPIRAPEQLYRKFVSDNE